MVKTARRGEVYTEPSVGVMKRYTLMSEEHYTQDLIGGAEDTIKEKVNFC